jgi:hypothetical protein
LAARPEGALRHFLQHVVAADGFDDLFLRLFGVVLVIVLVAMRDGAVFVLRNDGDFAALLLGNGFAFCRYGVMTPRLIMIMMVMMFIVVMVVLGMGELIVLMLVPMRCGDQGRGRLFGDDGRRLGRLAGHNRRRLSLVSRRSMIVVVAIVVMMIMIVVIIIMGMLVLMMIIVIFVMGMVLIAVVRLAEAVGVLALIGMSLGRMRLMALKLVALMAFELVTFMVIGPRCGRADDLALHPLSATAAA